MVHTAMSDCEVSRAMFHQSGYGPSPQEANGDELYTVTTQVIERPHKTQRHVKTAHHRSVQPAITPARAYDWFVLLASAAKLCG
jgi:hypothetical protein